MLTRCPACGTTFRVTPEQLKARYGRVRCGHCRGVFNALETLIEEPPAPAQAQATPVPTQDFEPPAVTAPAIAEAAPPPEPIAKPAAEPPSPPSPPEPVAQAPEPVAASLGETIDEADVEYVEISDAGLADDDFGDEFTDPGKPVEFSIKTQVNLAAIDEIDTVRDIVFSASLAPIDEPPPDFTKTVVIDFSHLAPPEEPAEDAGPMMEPIHVAETVVPPPEPPVSAVNAPKPGKVIEFPRSAPPAELPPEPDEVITLINECKTDRHDDAETVVDVGKFADAAKPAAPDSDDYTSTVINLDYRFAREPLDETETEEVVTLKGAPSFAEPPAQTSGPVVPTKADDTFAETEVISRGRLRPPPEVQVPSEEPRVTVLDFEIAPIEPEASRTARPAQPARPAGVAGPAVVAETLPPQKGPKDDFTKTVVMRFGGSEVSEHLVPMEMPPTAESRRKRSATEILDEPVLDLEPISDIHVEEVEEPPSLLSTIDEPRTVFPKFEVSPEMARMPSHETANAILSQLAGRSPGAVKTAAGPEAAPEPEKVALEPTVPPVTEPVTEARAGPATLPLAPEIELPAVAEPVPELQDIPSRRRWPWIVGSLVVGMVLVVQAIEHYRIELSAMMPRAKPALMAMCDVLNCKIPLPSQIELIGIESSDLSPGAEGAGDLQLSASLRNRAPFNQTWPHLELTLTDATDKALVRRALAPSEYLPATRKIEEGFPAASEQAISLALKAPGVPAAGYRLYVFYP